ncbi:MAG: hypothetical protein ACEPOW_05510 [Bacteroidales bacterium]
MQRFNYGEIFCTLPAINCFDDIYVFPDGVYLDPYKWVRIDLESSDPNGGNPQKKQIRNYIFAGGQRALKEALLKNELPEIQKIRTFLLEKTIDQIINNELSLYFQESVDLSENQDQNPFKYLILENYEGDNKIGEGEIIVAFPLK